MRPTTKDIAEAAGLSLATVDRVLNDRPNVSNRSRKKVQQAVDEMGYVRNLAAVNLAKNRTYLFRFIFPMSGDLYLQELIGQVRQAGVDMKSDLTDVGYEQISMQDPDITHFINSLLYFFA